MSLPLLGAGPSVPSVGGGSSFVGPSFIPDAFWILGEVAPTTGITNNETFADLCATPCILTALRPVNNDLFGGSAFGPNGVNCVAYSGVAASTDQLRNTSPPAKMNPSSGSWFHWLWLRYDTATITGNLSAWWDSVNGIGWKLAGTATQFQITSQQSSKSAQTLSFNSGITPTQGAVLFVAVWFDSVAGKLNGQVNNTGVPSTLTASAPGLGTASSILGIAGANNASTSKFSICRSGWVRSIPSASDRTILYNNGTPIQFNGTQWLNS